MTVFESQHTISQADDVEAKKPDEKPCEGSDDSEGVEDMDVGTGEKEKEGSGSDRKRAPKKKRASKKKGVFSRSSSGSGTKGR